MQVYPRMGHHSRALERPACQGRAFVFPGHGCAQEPIAARPADTPVPTRRKPRRSRAFSRANTREFYRPRGVSIAPFID